MKPLARDFLTGVTALAGLVGVIVTLWLIGDLKDVAQRSYTFTLKMNTASTLSDTSRVTLNGVRAGSVTAIVNEPNPADGVVLTLKIKHEIKIPENFTVYVDRGFVGESVLQLDVPSAEPGVPAAGNVQPGSVHARRVRTLFDVLSEPLQGPLGKLDSIATNFDTLTKTYNEVGTQATDLLKPRTEAELKDGKGPNLRTAIAKLETTLTDADAWLKDRELRESVQRTVTKVEGAVDKISSAADAWTTAAQSAESQISSLGPKAGEALQEAVGTMRRVGDAAEQVNAVAAAVNQGDGTAGQLLRNPDLYNSLRDAATRLEKALTELQLLLEKYKTEGIPLNL